VRDTCQESDSGSKQQPLAAVYLPGDEHCPRSDEITHACRECTFPEDFVPIPLSSSPFFVALLAPGNSSSLTSIVVIRVVGVVPLPDVRSDPHLDRARNLQMGEGLGRQRKGGQRATDTGGRTDHSPTQDGSAVAVILEENERVMGGGPADCLESQ
jgi:hypothetical protein